MALGLRSTVYDLPSTSLRRYLLQINVPHPALRANSIPQAAPDLAIHFLCLLEEMELGAGSNGLHDRARFARPPAEVVREAPRHAIVRLESRCRRADEGGRNGTTGGA